MKLQLIYSFYIADNECNNAIYKLHYNMIQKISSLFDKIIIIICHNGSEYDDVVRRIKFKFIDILNCKNISIIYEQNIKEYREGIIYKKYIIDKLNDYDGLTFFAHSKGVSNDYGLKYIDNLKLWIYSMYYLNFNWIDEVKNYIGEYSTFGNKYCYGALYFKDHRHNNIHNWFYSGSFQWINTKKLYKYIKENNIHIDQFISKENERLMRCAELFLGSVLPEKNCAFHNDEHYNKEYELFKFYGWEISYENINEMIKAYLKPGEYYELIDKYNKFINEFNE